MSEIQKIRFYKNKYSIAFTRIYLKQRGIKNKKCLFEDDNFYYTYTFFDDKLFKTITKQILESGIIIYFGVY